MCVAMHDTVTSYCRIIEMKLQFNRADTVFIVQCVSYNFVNLI